MRRWHAACLLLAALAACGEVLAQSAPPPDTSRRPVLRFVTDTDFPPFNYTDEDGALTGFNVDLARAICLELAATCDVKPRPWAQLIASLSRGEADAVIAGHAISARALAAVDFSDRYFHMPGRFIARRNTPPTDITPEGLYGKRIGVQKATAHEAYLRAFFKDSAIVAHETADSAREAIIAGSVDFVFDDGVSLVFWAHGTASRECCELRGGPFLEPRFFGDGMAIAVPKSDPQMRMQINTALRRVRASGRYEELLLRYFPARVF